MTPLNRPTPKTIRYNQQLRIYLTHNRSYDSSKNFLIFPIGAIVFFLIFEKNQLNIKFKHFSLKGTTLCHSACSELLFVTIGLNYEESNDDIHETAAILDAILIFFKMLKGDQSPPGGF